MVRPKDNAEPSDVEVFEAELRFVSSDQYGEVTSGFVIIYGHLYAAQLHYLNSSTVSAYTLTVSDSCELGYLQPDYDWKASGPH